MKIYLKDKAHKKYEFRNKVGLVLDGKSKVILAVESYTGKFSMIARQFVH